MLVHFQCALYMYLQVIETLSMVTPFPVIGLVPSKYSNIEFLIQIARFRVTHERNIIFARTPCKEHTNWHRKLPLRDMNKFPFVISPFRFFGKPLGRSSLKLTTNGRTMDVIPVIVNIVVKVLLRNVMTKGCRRCRPKNPVRVKNKSGKGGWKITATGDKK